MESDSFELRGRNFPKWKREIIDEQEVTFETEEWHTFKIQRKLEIELNSSGLCLSPFLSFDQYVGSDVPNNIPKLREYVSEFNKKFNSINLYLWSSRNGTQKSTIAKIICYELIKQGKKVQFVLMGTLLKSLTNENFEDSKSSKFELIDLCRNADFLVVDDSFDPMKATMYKSGYQLSFLDMFLRQRIEENRKATCFTSNIAPEEIDSKVFGVSMKALVVRSVPVPMEFNDGISDFNPMNLWAD